MSGNQVDQLLNDVGWYEGEYKDGKYHGQGIYSYPDRSKFGTFAGELISCARIRPHDSTVKISSADNS